MTLSDGDTGQYLIARCMLLAKHKTDYLATDTFNHRVEIILRDAEKLGITKDGVNLWGKVLATVS